MRGCTEKLTDIVHFRIDLSSDLSLSIQKWLGPNERSRGVHPEYTNLIDENNITLRDFTNFLEKVLLEIF